MTSTAERLESELGRGEAISAFVAEAVVTINQIDPGLDYRHGDLFGFVQAAWPYDGEPADAAAEFAESLAAQRAAE